MKIHYVFREGLLVLTPEGELDHHCAMADLARMKELVETMLPPKVILDLHKMPFTDSSGIAVVLGLYRAVGQIGSEMAVINTQSQPMKVLRAAGVDRMLPFREEVHI